MTTDTFTDLGDADLLARAQVLAADERRATADLVACLAEVDARRLYLPAGCASLFAWCTQVLQLSESAAYARIEAARAARRYPPILEALHDGRFTLSTVCLLARVLTAGNQAELLTAAAHKSKREVELLVARVRPQPPVAATIRKRPSPRGRDAAPDTATPSSAPQAGPPLAEPRDLPAPRTASRPVVRPLAPETYKVQFTLSREGHDRLRRAQDLLRHAMPTADVAVVFERALTLLVEHLERQKCAATTRPRQAGPATARSRHIPAAIKRAVWRRDDGQCAFVGTHGRCRARGFLEFHHVLPYADGGETSVANLQLRCAAHNAYEAMLWSGADVARERAGPWLGGELGPDRVAARERLALHGTPHDRSLQLYRGVHR